MTARTTDATRYLDGMRGCAALYVAINHLVDHYVRQGRALERHSGFLDAASGFTFGRFSVAVFIVLSGYVLAKPIVQNQPFALRGGLVSYLLRRSWRILPPYYAALLLSLLAIAVFPLLRSMQTPMWASALPITADAVIAHLLLVHNLQDGWIFRINAPLWSVATEYQIYFLLPLVFLPLWRRLSFAWATAIAIGLGVAPALVTTSSPILASPWFVSLFVMGMAASRINFSIEERADRWRRFPWGECTLALSIALTSLCLTSWRVERPWMVSELLVGASTTCLLVTCTRSKIDGRGAALRLVHVFESKPLLLLGAFSYSLYLVHQPVLSLIAGSIHFNSLKTQLVVCLLAGLPCCLATAYVFHRIFERPFMTLRSDRFRTAVSV